MQIEISDKSLDLALVKASGQLGVPHTQIDYEVLREEKKLWGLLGKTITINAWVNEQKPNLRNKKAPQTKRTCSTPKETLIKMKDFCEELCTMIAQEKVSLSDELKGPNYYLRCKNEFLKKKLSKTPKLAESIERILLRVFKDDIKDRSFRVFFDAGGVRAEKEKDLVTLAKTLSKKATRSRKTITLHYKHAHDRKVIHTALDSDPRVYTKSVGTGAGRKLLIIPTKGNERRSHGHSR